MGSGLLLVLICAGALAASASASRDGRAGQRPASVTAPRATAAASACGTLPAQRDPENPLALAVAPGANPLTGANFFVDGPSHGLAAGQIARLLGIDSSTPVESYLSAFPANESWASFLANTVTPKLGAVSAGVRNQIMLLEKIASEPETERVSFASSGGSPAGISAFVNKLFCTNFTADPGSVPVISTYFMHGVLGGCPTTAQINAYMPRFRRQVDAVVRATGDRRVVYLLELDAVGSSACIRSHGSLPAWESMLRYEVDAMSRLPHAVVYIEGGYSDSGTPAKAAQILNAVDIHRVRGFFTNDTHLAWTSNEIKYGQIVSRLTHGSHFIVNTAQNGRGPLLNPHPLTEGVEDLCNPPNRGLGPQPTTSTGFHKVDAFLWTAVPGNSSGTCNAGPSSGIWWPARAISLAALANAKLGPGLPSKPY